MSRLFILLLLATFMITCQAKKVDIERNLYEMDKLIRSKDFDENGICQSVLDKFSEFSAKFVLCANKFAKPISMCRECAGHFIDLNVTYQMLSNTSEDGSGVHCKDILTAQDRVEIIQETYDYIAAEPTKNNPTQGLWSKGHCNSCYNLPLTHDSNHSEKTVEFFARHSKVQDCFAQYPFDEGESERNSSEACLECQHVYRNLSHYYIYHVLDNTAPFTATVCFDILDAINMTQRLWGEKYNCGRRPTIHWGLIVAVCIVLSMPLIFYPVVYFIESSAEERVINQRHITDFFDQNLRRLTFNRNRFSRMFGGDEDANNNDNKINNIIIRSQ
jgi:hypothetical protein